ncbi:MAG: CPBP family intramembrane metalloprotease, partial [Actinomycetota bacterium]|nr:CPBP family intramembrane metalloprotease [Actinomycetota bacterium]
SEPLPEQAAPRRRELRWRWAHLWAVGICAWGLPTVLTPVVAQRFDGRGMLDSALVVQIAAYVLAAFVAALLVSRVQGGDWSSVGIRWSERAYEDVFRGAGFGLLLLAGFTGFELARTGGHLEVDGLVKLLVGGTSGPGLFLAALVVVVGAPVIEEIYYRGMLYEKFGRWGRVPAIFGTSVLFVSAHGALIIPSLLLLAFGLAWKRQTKSLWYTMGGHAAWNLVVISMGIFVISGPAQLFSPPDEAYSLRFPAKWDRAEEMETAMDGMSLDLMLGTPTQSMIAVARVELPPGTTPRMLGSILGNVPASLMASGDVGITKSGLHETDLVETRLGKAYELKASGTDPVVGGFDTRLVTVVPGGSSKATMFMMVCPTAECADVNTDFDALLDSVHFDLPAAAPVAPQ